VTSVKTKPKTKSKTRSKTKPKTKSVPWITEPTMDPTTREKDNGYIDAWDFNPHSLSSGMILGVFKTCNVLLSSM